jgi:hypothetical protein
LFITGSSSSLPQKEKKQVKPFSHYKKLNSQEWKSSTSKKPEKDVTVQIMIGLMEMNTKEMRLKPKRGKRIGLSVSSKVSYCVILDKAVEKWKAFNSDVYDDETEDYVLLLENSKPAQFLPGNEHFTLHRYHEEVGRDYNKIVLYLCTETDLNFEHEPRCNKRYDSDSDEMSAPAKKIKKEAKKTSCVDLTCESDENIARELQIKFDMEMHDIPIHMDDTDEKGKEYEEIESTENVKDSTSVLKLIENKVIQSGQFFLTVRRGESFERMISLWKRESKKSSPEKVLRVQYCGERGIDTGAMSQEFLANTIRYIGKAMFPDGAPINSMSHVHNQYFHTCGQIVAVSLAQGGPTPNFMDGSVYQLMVKVDEIDINNLSDVHFTNKDKKMLQSVLETETCDEALIDVNFGKWVQRKN